MYFLKKLIRCFIPYGFFVLRLLISEKQPLYMKFMRKIEKGTGKEKKNILQIFCEDYKHPIYLRNHTSDIWVYRQIFEEYEYSFIVKKEPKCIIDAGANIGMAAVYFANKYKDAKIIAIEPEKNNFEILVRNTENYANIMAVNAALWNNSGEITLFDTGLDNVGFMVETNVSALNTGVKDRKHLTKAITVEEIMHKFNIDFIDIFKMDIEGAEKEVLESCHNWVGKTNCIIVELHERMKKGCNKSFYNITKFFDRIGVHGEDIYLVKNNYIKII